jgi:hypothetical protein
LKRFLEHCRGLKAKGKLKLKVGVPSLITVIEFIEILFPMLGLPLIPIPFRAQHVILQTLQRHLEHSAFQFVQKWLLPQSLAVGWTCPEALELHKFFKLLAKNRSKISSEQCCANITPVQNLRHSIASIRHAAVHRLTQDRDSLLEMVYAAIEFCLCIGESPGAEKLCGLLRFLQKTLPKPSIKQRQSQQTTPFQASSPKSPLREPPNHRLLTLPEVIGRLVECIEKT